MRKKNLIAKADKKKERERGNTFLGGKVSLILRRKRRKIMS